MEIAIRACHAGDAAVLALVGQATFLETYAGDMEVSDLLAHCQVEHGAARYAGWLADPAYRLWIAEAAAGQAPVGYAVVCPPDLPMPTDEGDLELLRIYVLHRFHGTGLGARLMQTACDTAAAAGAGRMFVSLYDDNHQARAFYARQGFADAGRRPFRIGASVYDDLVMVRPLVSVSASSSASSRRS